VLAYGLLRHCDGGKQSEEWNKPAEFHDDRFYHVFEPPDHQDVPLAIIQGRKYELTSLTRVRDKGVIPSEASMMLRKVLISTAILTLPCATFLVAKDFWEKPYKEWKKSDVERMKENSPWAKSQTMADTTTEKVGVGGDREMYNNVIVRFFSALPIRQAYVRQLQIMNGYDEKGPQERAQIDQKFSVALTRDFSKVIMIALDYRTNDPRRRMDVDRWLTTLRVDQLKQSCYLISDRIGRVTIDEYYPPSQDGTGAKFVFPREVDGKPVVAPEDKELKFDFYFDPVGQKVFITFKVKNMMFDGKLEM
jgi:hypothetical protein